MKVKKNTKYSILEKRCKCVFVSYTKYSMLGKRCNCVFASYQKVIVLFVCSCVKKKKCTSVNTQFCFSNCFTKIGSHPRYAVSTLFNPCSERSPYLRCLATRCHSSGRHEEQLLCRTKNASSHAGAGVNISL